MDETHLDKYDVLRARATEVGFEDIANDRGGNKSFYKLWQRAVAITVTPPGELNVLHRYLMTYIKIRYVDIV